MKIAFFTDTWLPQIDGVVIALLNLRRELEARGHKVYVFAPGKDDMKEGDVFYFKSTTFSPYPDYKVALFPFPSAEKITKELGIDVVHSHGIAMTGLAAIQCANKLGIPKIATYHTMVTQATHYLSPSKGVQKLISDVGWKYLRWYYNSFDVVTVPSEFAERILKKEKIENTIVVPNGIYIENFEGRNGAEIRKRYGLENKKIVLSVGRLVKEKKLDEIISVVGEVANKEPDIMLVVAGDGPAREHFESIAKEKMATDHVLFLGRVENDTIADLYAAADVFATASTFETQGLVVLEAFAAGKPVVVKRNTAPAEYVKEGINGYLFDTCTDLPEKILKALALSQNERTAAECKKSVEKFHMKAMAETMERIYAEWIEKKKKIS
ncbi:MAG: glycosyltransferase [Candidatus Anstonellales archaeon]